MRVSKRKAQNFGKEKSPEEFLEAYRKYQHAEYSIKPNRLVAGAVEAFREGKTENLQMLFTDISLLYHRYRDIRSVSVFQQLTEGLEQDSAAALIGLVLTKASDETKQEILDQTLYQGIRNEKLCAALITAGANPGAEIDGDVGFILISAASRGAPISTVKLLHDNGASFEDALTTAYVKGYNSETRERLEFFRNKLEGKPQPAKEVLPPALTEKANAVFERAEDPEIKDLLRQILAVLDERLPPAAENKPAATSRRLYPRL